MTRPLTVYFYSGAFAYGYKRQVTAVVAATSKAAAARAFRVSAYAFNLYVSEGDTPEAVAAALSDPGTVFVRGMPQEDRGWEPNPERPQT